MLPSQAVPLHRVRIREAVRLHRVRDVWVFGQAPRGDETEGSGLGVPSAEP